jgi:hypothetical protein
MDVPGLIVDTVKSLLSIKINERFELNILSSNTAWTKRQTERIDKNTFSKVTSKTKPEDVYDSYVSVPVKFSAGKQGKNVRYLILWKLAFLWVDHHEVFFTLDKEFVNKVLSYPSTYKVTSHTIPEKD